MADKPEDDKTARSEVELLEEWERALGPEDRAVLAALAAVERTRQEDPQGWAEYLAEAEQWDQVSAPIDEPPWGKS